MRARLLLASLVLAGCHRLFDLPGLESMDAANGSGDRDAGGTDRPDASGSSLVVFASSQWFSGNMGGLAGADAMCTSLAGAAGLPGTYQAWLSSATESPSTRMNRGGPYVLVNGATVATNWADLTDGTIRTPINIDEHGNGVVGEYICSNGELWSNTDTQGNSLGDSCSGWTSTSGSSGNGGGARVAATDANWTSPAQCWPLGCTVALAIYCFQQ